MASATQTTTLSSPVVGVLRIIGMAKGTVGFGALYCCRYLSGFATLDVLGMSNQFEVIGPNAGTIPTEMIPFKSSRGFANEEVMRSCHLPVDPECSIASFNTASYPDDTSVRSAGINLLPKAFFYGKTFGMEVHSYWHRMILSVSMQPGAPRVAAAHILAGMSCL